VHLYRCFSILFGQLFAIENTFRPTLAWIEASFLPPWIYSRWLDCNHSSLASNTICLLILKRLKNCNLVGYRKFNHYQTCTHTFIHKYTYIWWCTGWARELGLHKVAFDYYKYLLLFIQVWYPDLWYPINIKSGILCDIHIFQISAQHWYTVTTSMELSYPP
jgi:hypothetical protein